MKLEYLGYNKELEDSRIENGFADFDIGRVVLEHKERYVVKTSVGEFYSEILGQLRFTAKNRRDFPAVGDWVAFQEYDTNKGIIHGILPRKSLLERQAVGKDGEAQIIAANIDVALIVQAVDRDFNINRIQRYLTICHSAGIEALIVLNKIDLIDASELSEKIEEIENRDIEAPVIAISNESKKGYDQLKVSLQAGKTYCLLGSSGVGKSTLVNNLSGESLMETGSLSDSTNKGMHVTSHRELIVLDGGAIMIDNPGMREVGVVASEMGMEQTFDLIYQLSKKCKFSNCTHLHEKGCAVLEAVENKTISEEQYENFRKLEKEKEHYDSTVYERRKKDKEFGKMIKTTLKNKKKYD